MDREDELQEIIDESREETRSLLLLDHSNDEFSHKFFEKSSEYVILDGKILHRKKFIRNTPLRILLDECRHLLLYAMFRGKALVIRMGELSVDFLGTFCDENCGEGDLAKENPYPPYQVWHYLPRGFLLFNGAMLNPHSPSSLTPFSFSSPSPSSYSALPYSLVRNDDLHEMKDQLLRQRSQRSADQDDEPTSTTTTGYAAAAALIESGISSITSLTPEEIKHPNFRVIITSTIPGEKVKDLLFNGRFGLPTDRPGDFVIREFPSSSAARK